MRTSTIIEIDLGEIRSKDQLLDLLGDVLELGGQGGNVNVKGPLDGKGWGKNWDGLADSLGYLDTGGIWGTSKKLSFPLLLRFSNFHSYRANGQPGWDILKEILDDTVDLYARNKMSFRYECT